MFIFCAKSKISIEWQSIKAWMLCLCLGSLRRINVCGIIVTSTIIYVRGAGAAARRRELRIETSGEASIESRDRKS